MVFCADTKNHHKYMQKKSIETLKQVAVCLIEKSSCLHNCELEKRYQSYTECDYRCNIKLNDCYKKYNVEATIQEWKRAFDSSSSEGAPGS